MRGDMAVDAGDAGPPALPQSPLACRREILAGVFDQAAARGLELGATWEELLRGGVEVFAVPNEDSNIRIATRLDWAFARRVLWPALQKRGLRGKTRE